MFVCLCIHSSCNIVELTLVGVVENLNISLNGSLKQNILSLKLYIRAFVLIDMLKKTIGKKNSKQCIEYMTIEKVTYYIIFDRWENRKSSDKDNIWAIYQTVLSINIQCNYVIMIDRNHDSVIYLFFSHHKIIVFSD